jgi:hypothetical protein
VSRDDKRLFAGALCGIASSVALSFLLRHHYAHWPVAVRHWLVVVWHWLDSKPGLYSLTISGLVCQLGGVVLVVLEISRSNWRLWWLDHWFAELGKQVDSFDPKALAQEATAQHHNKRLSEGQRTVFSPELSARLLQPVLVYQKDIRYLVGVTNILRTFPRLTHERPAAPAWVGPTLLLLGIVFAGTAGLVGIAAPR